ALQKKRQELILLVSNYFKQENNELHNRFSNIFHSFDLYNENLMKIGLKNLGLIGKMREVAHSVEKKLSKNPKDLIILLGMRRDGKDYLLRQDTTYAKNFFLKSA